MKNKILDTIKFIIGVVTIILVLVFQTNMMLAAFIGSIGLSLYGILSCILGNKYGYLFTSLGISLCVALGIYKIGLLPKFESITFFMCMSLSLFIVIAFVFEIINEKQMLLVHDMEVEGFVVDLVLNPNTKKEYYQPIYQYEVDGETYVVGTPGYIEKDIPRIGDLIKLHVNSKDVTDVYFSKTLKEKIHMASLGIFLIVVSIIIIITLF